MRQTTARGLVAAVVFASFLLMRLLSRRISQSDIAPSLIPDDHGPTKLHRVKNNDMSLCVPFLDKINNFWHVSGGVQIRNHAQMRLTSAGTPNSYGVLLSNGAGDNIIRDFEVILKFRISPRPKGSVVGDGLCLTVTSDNSFMNFDQIRSGYAREQTRIQSQGLLMDNHEMMGLPKNLPGLSLILDTFANVNSWSSPEVPFLDVILNLNPEHNHYDLKSDNLKSTSIKLTQMPLKLRKTVMQGDITELRLIYFETVPFLKIDIKYHSEGDYWIELYHTHEPVLIPKARASKERFLGIGALNGDASGNVDILEMTTNEFHWSHNSNNVDNDPTEDTLDYAKEIQKLLSREFGETIALEADDFMKWKMRRSQPNLQIPFTRNSGLENSRTKVGGKNRISKKLMLCIVGIMIYLGSVYVRVTRKHVRHRHRRQMVLPL